LEIAAVLRCFGGLAPPALVAPVDPPSSWPAKAASGYVYRSPPADPMPASLRSGHSNPGRRSWVFSPTVRSNRRASGRRRNSSERAHRAPAHRDLQAGHSRSSADPPGAVAHKTGRPYDPEPSRTTAILGVVLRHMGPGARSTCPVNWCLRPVCTHRWRAET